MLKQLTFFDFCSGIGAGHIALKNRLGLKCSGYSEIDRNAEETYKKITLIGKKIKNWGDLTRLNPKKLPNFDLMIAGFPCQPFSIMGTRAGTRDARGQIIYSLINILKIKQPNFFLLENVKGLVNHDNGLTINLIKKNFRK